MSTEIREIAADSAIGRALHALGRIAMAGWTTSRTASLLRRGDAQWRGSAAALRIRVVALLVACVSIGQVLSLWVLPRYALSGLPKMWFIAAALLAGVAAAIAAPLASAWSHSRTAKGFGVVSSYRRAP